MVILPYSWPLGPPLKLFYHSAPMCPAKEGKTWRPSHLRERISNLVSRSSRLQDSPICELEDRGRRIGVGQPLNHPWTLLAQGHTKVSKAGDLNSESLYLNQFVLRIKLRR